MTCNDITTVQKKVIPAFRNDRTPRTAMRKTHFGKGSVAQSGRTEARRQHRDSLDMLATLLLKFGADQAINLDGGGSTTMVVRDKVVNHPSDPTGECQ